MKPAHNQANSADAKSRAAKLAALFSNQELGEAK